MIISELNNDSAAVGAALFVADRLIEKVNFTDFFVRCVLVFGSWLLCRGGVGCSLVLSAAFVVWFSIVRICYC